MKSFGIFLALALLCAAAPSSAMQAGGAPPPPPATEAAVPADWRVETNRTVAEANHWRWRLRALERRGDTLTVGLSYRNGASTGRPIYLEPDYMDSIALVDGETGTRFALLGVTGVSDNAVAIGRRSSQSAEFTFRFPEGASSVLFDSRWVSMQMQGAAAAMEVAFPIALPSAGS